LAECWNVRLDPQCIGRQIAVWRFHHQVVVIAHQAIGMHYPVEALADNSQNIEPVQSVIVSKIDILTLVTT